MKDKFKLFTIITLICTSSISLAVNPRYDFRTDLTDNELRKMHEFHLQQAQTKLDSAQLAYAWGDYAYLLCQIPNHHVALEKMSALALQINKQHEMQQYFEQAITNFPDDNHVKDLYATFKSSTDQL